jgi:hypothetical protein
MWLVSPIEAYVQFEGQSDQSYMVQKLAVEIGICSIDKYLQQLGPRAATQTKNVLIHGIPGSGMSSVAQYLNLYVISQGRRLVPTSIMGVRATNLGGKHMHRLFGLSTKKMANVSCMAELAVDKLNRKSQLCCLHTLLTIDVLLFDEFGQASAKQVKTLDILFTKLATLTFRLEVSCLFQQLILLSLVLSMDYRYFCHLISSLTLLSWVYTLL